MIDLSVALAGLFVGVVVGLTGMGGGALMTPILVFYGVPPLAAVSSDIVASMVMKPVGGGVHLKRGTVNKRLVTWLVLGSVPSAFFGVFALKSFGGSSDLQSTVKLALGIALAVVATGLIVRPLLQRRRQGESQMPLMVKPLPTLLIGIVGGTVVGITSVGSGSLMMILLLMLYPRLRLSELVGTDLVQAVPLVTSAAIAHLIFGDFELGITASILVGSIPGVFVGARFSSRAPDHVIRPALIVVLAASSLKLLGVGNLPLAVAVVALTAWGVYYGVNGARKAAQERAAQERKVDEQPLPLPASDAAA
ncbi:MAG TPA: sulfite exporter TauE/SafE family protein [Polyangiaceae bacterium]|nr:sulfite exporter TauE/SafE family protein [Polyangiaceae bacterium]